VDALLDDPALIAPLAPHLDPWSGWPSTAVKWYLRPMFVKFRYRRGPHHRLVKIAALMADVAATSYGDRMSGDGLPPARESASAPSTPPTRSPWSVPERPSSTASSPNDLIISPIPHAA
jgi:hypothetical protein